jgi:16S rRNA (guanine(966)-N(2))-methyltransferase RsmD
VRAALLNSLQPLLDDSLVLDLFAGSGAVGIEAVSRGARGAYFVEAAPAALKALKTNLTEMERRAAKQSLSLAALTLEVLTRNVSAALDSLLRLAPADRPVFDIIFMDPPYREAVEQLRALAPLIAGLSEEGATLIIETSSASLAAMNEMLAQGETSPLAAWHLLKQKTYGDTMLTTFEKNWVGRHEQS